MIIRSKKIKTLLVLSALTLAMSTAVFAEDTVSTPQKRMHTERLSEIAKEKGITVEELKEQMKAKREERLVKKAEEKGITVEELKEQMRQHKTCPRLKSTKDKQSE